MRSQIPTGFVPLAPEVALKAIEGHEDILAGEHRTAEALYRQHLDCPRGCGRTMEKSLANVEFAFSDPNWLIPRCVMKCNHCGCTMNPFDGMVVAMGDPDTANAGAKIIK